MKIGLEVFSASSRVDLEWGCKLIFDVPYAWIELPSRGRSSMGEIARCPATAIPATLTPSHTSRPGHHALTSHTAKEASKSHAATAIAAFAPYDLARIHNSHNAVASIGNPIACLNRSSQGPGLGSHCKRPGLQASRTYGNAKPNPTAVKIRRDRKSTRLNSSHR